MPVTRVIAAAVAACHFALLAPSSAAGQEPGRIEGHVVHPERGAPAAGAEVIVAGAGARAETDADGRYVLGRIPAGVYDVEVRVGGRTVLLVRQQRVLAGRTVQLDVRLPAVGAALEPVVVQGERTVLAPADQLRTAAVLTAEEIAAAPVESVADLVSMLPGANDVGDGRGFVFRGAPPGDATVYLDGVPLRSFQAGRQAMLLLPRLAFEQADLRLGGFGAEYGHAESAVIDLVSRRGAREWSGVVGLATDQLALENGYGYTRLEGGAAGPLTDRLSLSIAGTVIGMEDARPTFGADALGTVSVTHERAGTVRVPLAPQRWFRETGGRDTVRAQNGDVVAILREYEELTGLGERKPFSNGDVYAFDVALHAEPRAGTRLSAGLTLSRAQSRLFDPMLAFRPHSLPAWREKGWLVRAELAHDLFRNARSGATLRLVAGFGRGEAVEGFLGETLADTARVRDGELYPMEGDVLGFTFADFRFPFEGAFTYDRWAARLDSMRANATLNYLLPFETLINPATGRPFTFAEAIDVFDMRFGVDNPYGISDFLATGFPGYGRRTERVAYLRAGLDLDLGPAHRLGIGGEVLRSVAEELTAVGPGIGGTSFGGAYHAEPTLAALWATDRLRAGPVALEVGLRADLFTGDARFPALPGFVLPVRVGDTTYEPEFVDQETSVRLSPRVAAAVPVGPIRVRASYGHYSKAPAFDQVYAGMNADVNKVAVGQSFGRPLELGHTEAFEVGLTLRPDARTTVDIAGYQRETADRPRYSVFTADYPGMGPRTVRSVSNAGADRSRGVELRIGRRIGEGVEVRVGYAHVVEVLEAAAGQIVDPVTGQVFFGPKVMLTSGFDRPHTFSLVTTAATPAGAAGDGILRRLVSDWSATLLFQAASGQPYTRTNTYGATARGLGPDPVFVEPLNSSRMPATYRSDLRLARGFTIGGRTLGAYIDVRNLLNHRATLDLFTRTGSATDPGEAFLLNNTLGSARMPGSDVVVADVQDPLQRALLGRRERFFGNGDGVLTVEEQLRSSLGSFVASGWGSQIDVLPGMFYGSPRQVRVGVEWRF